MVKVKEFQVIHFDDTFVDDQGDRGHRRIILLYALGADGVVYEFNGGKWLPYPIDENNLRASEPVQSADKRKSATGRNNNGRS